MTISLAVLSLIKSVLVDATMPLNLELISLLEQCMLLSEISFDLFGVRLPASENLGNRLIFHRSDRTGNTYKRKMRTPEACKNPLSL